jgi:hypothetical protein
MLSKWIISKTVQKEVAQVACQSKQLQPNLVDGRKGGAQEAPGTRNGLLIGLLRPRIADTELIAVPEGRSMEKSRGLISLALAALLFAYALLTPDTPFYEDMGHFVGFLIIGLIYIAPVVLGVRAAKKRRISPHWMWTSLALPPIGGWIAFWMIWRREPRTELAPDRPPKHSSVRQTQDVEPVADTASSETDREPSRSGTSFDPNNLSGRAIVIIVLLLVGIGVVSAFIPFAGLTIATAGKYISIGVMSICVIGFILRLVIRQ